MLRYCMTLVRDRATWTQEQEDGVVERRRKLATAAKGGPPLGKARAQPAGEDPDDGNDDDDEEDRKPCKRCKAKKITRLKQAGKRSSVICKPCHDSKVQCSYLGRPYTVKREGGASPSGEQLAVLESQMVQEDDHARLISMDTRMALMEESEEEEEEEKEMEEKEKEVEKDGEGEEEEMEEETAPTEAQSEKGKGRAEE
ncbi:hypothetical protein F5051DRAFT_445113 [Lentinula edodes]|nr:hypothetical protein F5051DRAFT_445113 [Lentinula edodes]